MKWENLGIFIGEQTGQIRTLCPKCSGQRNKKTVKCLAVNTDLGTAFCHHCGWKYPESKTGNPIHHRIYMPASTVLPQNIQDFFKMRGITEPVIKRNRIGHSNGWIVFPYLKDGKIINNKYRSLSKEFRQEKGAEKIVYGIDDIKNHEVCYWVEGEMDKLACEVAGVKNVVSVPDGAPPLNSSNFGTKFDFLVNIEDCISHIQKHIILADFDIPGGILKKELIKRLGVEKCYEVFLPPGIKDANQMLMEYGEQSLAQVLQNYTPVPINGLLTAGDLSKQIDELYDKGIFPGVSSGWISVDRHYMVKTGYMTIVTGIPSHGKSEFIDALTMNLASKSSWNIAVFSPENFPVELHISKLIQKYVGKPFSKTYNNHMTETEKEMGKKFINDHYVFLAVEDASISLNLDKILDLAKTAIFRYGVNGIVIDPWNEIEHARPQGISETEYISICLTKIRRFCRENDVHIWLVAHPTKLQKVLIGENKGQYPVPTPYDISGSANWRNKADFCLSIWRDIADENGIVEIHIQKVRFREMGKPGMVALRYDIKSGRYLE